MLGDGVQNPRSFQEIRFGDRGGSSGLPVGLELHGQAKATSYSECGYEACIGRMLVGVLAFFHMVVALDLGFDLT